jgi:hypothetical protein
MPSGPRPSEPVNTRGPAAEWGRVGSGRRRSVLLNRARRGQLRSVPEVARTAVNPPFILVSPGSDFMATCGYSSGSSRRLYWRPSRVAGGRFVRDDSEGVCEPMSTSSQLRLPIKQQTQRCAGDHDDDSQNQKTRCHSKATDFPLNFLLIELEVFDPLIQYRVFGQRLRRGEISQTQRERRNGAPRSRQEDDSSVHGRYRCNYHSGECEKRSGAEHQSYEGPRKPNHQTGPSLGRGRAPVLTGALDIELSPRPL